MNYQEELGRLINVGIEERKGKFAYVVADYEVAEFTYARLVHLMLEADSFGSEAWFCDNSKTVGGYDFTIDIIAVEKTSCKIDGRLRGNWYDIISYDDTSLEQYTKDRLDVK
jgi:hypothetical protein|tara:strand:+ start:489 stop:824 length:336 start_codon:yes stop_codon:yes gene_type:complete